MPPTDSGGAAIEERDVVAALGRVRDPQLNESIVVLNLVKEIEIDGRAVRVTVAIPSPGRDYESRLVTEINGALLPLGVEDVDVSLVPMSDEDRASLPARLQGAGTGASRSQATPSGAAGMAQGQSGTPFDQSPSPLMDLEGRTRIIAISSGKGGVGKSSITTNLALALARRGKDVAVIDADVYGFSVPGMLGVTEEPDVEEEKIVPPEVDGVKVVSMGFFIEEDQAVIWRGPMLHKALEQFISDVRWGEPDFLVVDMPPGTGDVALSMSQFLPRAEVVIVTTPQPAAQRVAQRSAAMARKVNMSVIGVIENMSWFTGDDSKRYEIFGAGGGKVLADSLGVPLLGQVPLTVDLRMGADEGVPVITSDPESEAAVALFDIADKLIAAEPRRIRKPELSIQPEPAPGGGGTAPGAPGRSGLLQVTPKRPGS